ncbi:MAG: CmcJ/NvfI family oxidoreductase [Myxococcota bacterium]
MTEGTFRYLTADTASSLMRNGRVCTRRDLDGSDSETVGVELDVVAHPIRNGREGDTPTLEAQGFALVPDAPLRDTPDFMDHEAVVRRYYPDCEARVAEASGATHVFAFDHNVRSASGKRDRTRIAGGQEVQAPAHVVHGDYTLTSAPARLRDLTRPPGRNDTLRAFLPEGAALVDQDLAEQALAPGGRFALINVWRNIVAEPVVTDPLALCDAQTVEPSDLVVFEIHYADRVGENYFAKSAQRHRWVSFPELTRDEGLLIKQWDAAGPLARSEGARGDASEAALSTFSFHSAYREPDLPDDAPDRWSIEVRCVALWS